MILDADVLIDLLRLRPNAMLWLRSLADPPAASGIAALEVLYGAQNIAEQRAVDTWLRQFEILWPSEADSQAARTLAPYRLSDGIEMTDCITAAVALRHNLTVVTFNVKHYRAIPGLSTVQPYARS
jgi:predicted nucleic acid-binding protein